MKSYLVLFIGNSYTYFNDMPSIFKGMAESLGYDVTVESITSGGYKLSQYCDPQNPFGAKVKMALSGEKRYDFVVLQEQSIRPASENAPDFFASVRQLVGKIKSVNATPVLYSTWGRKAGCDTLDEYGWTNESMTYKLAAAYRAIGKEQGALVADVGLAFFDVNKRHAEIDLYDPDKSHPSPSGSFLAAATILIKTLGGKLNESVYAGELNKSEASVLYSAANRVTSGEIEIPSEYEIKL